ncbi:hypothetical protein PEG85_06240 [Lactococcus cremoris]|jgi:hypothetical protein|uniref:Uncharacterized protein n=1 Tax=Lactococcus lactis subsp. cremoris TaxID=1359 RepID=A0AAX4AJH3_LACLC|nr:hypothetical protein [Lactococcus cremoris]KZK10388.1 hypothetical protein V4_0608 [Lactococcus cremoris]KZK41325.1 hypothetical protein N41_0381 [Lactococcus cremoris]KZK53441.1 hypothetical protein NCDO763_0224 [Lactococcus cremoris]MCZ7688379.1 hypothetical protein [Lactococcus cremoris]MCZ7691036.1 hypothetical protein [Lactococcus cremoris]
MTNVTVVVVDSNKKHLPRDLASVKSIKTSSFLLTENPVSKNKISFS